MAPRTYLYLPKRITSAEEAEGTPTRSHISPSILVYEDNNRRGLRDAAPNALRMEGFLGRYM